MALETGTTNDREVIEDLLAHVQDSINGYTDAAEIVKDPQLGDLFRRRAASRQKVANQFAERLRTLQPGEAVNREGTTAGHLHQGFMKLRASIQDNEKAALAEVDRGESYLAERFERALERDVSVETRNLIQQFLTQIESEKADVERLHSYA
jgi:uncharacterized protein (TIGR02284 family)